MRTKKLLPGFILFSTILLYFSCKKSDISSSSDKTITKNSIKEKFFNTHRTSDPKEKSLVEFLKRINEKENFVEKTAKQIGYPRWDKAFTKSKKNLAPSFQASLAGDSCNTYYIPFVRDSQNFVNASMIINAYPSDTTFSYIVDWQYNQKQNSTNSISDSAEHFAVFFMFMDKEVFGYDEFKILDSNLFRANGKSAKKITLSAAVNSPGTGNLLAYVEYCQNVSVYFNDCNNNVNQNNAIPGAPCEGTIFYTYCWGEWEDDGGGGGGTGTGSTGGGGSSTPPNPCGGTPNNPQPFANQNNFGSNQNNVNAPCGGSGGGWTPIPIDDDPPQPQDPCAVAQNAARKMDTLFTKCKADSVLSSIPNLATETKEKGFPIYKKITISPTNPLDTTSTSYSTGNIQTGTDSSIVISYSTTNLRFLAGVVHTHPDSSYSAQSAADIYTLIEQRLTETQTVGNFVAAANGSQYGIIVTNPSLAFPFLGTRSLFLDGTKWNDTSVIGKAFDKAKIHFEGVYKGNPNQANLAYEMAMAAVLNQFNTGVTLTKKDSYGNFKPIVIKTALDPQKPKRTTYIQECV